MSPTRHGPHHVGHLIRLAQQIHTRTWATEVSPDVTSTQFQLLSVLASNPDVDQRTATELARLDRSTGAELIERLERTGFLERRRDTIDRRRYLLRLTETGETVLRELQPAARQVGEHLLDLVPEALREPFVEALTSFVEAGEATGSRVSRGALASEPSARQEALEPS